MTDWSSTCRGWSPRQGVVYGCAGYAYRTDSPRQCPACMRQETAARTKARIGRERQVQRKAAQGYGPAAEGADVFTGFKG